MSWLKRYYGKSFEDFNPQVFVEGDKFAVVQITKSMPRGFSGMGFVLIKKNGNHQTDTSKSLHEGPLTEAARERLKAALRKAEK